MARSESFRFPTKGLPVTRWFSSRGSVVSRGTSTEVFIGGTLIGCFEEDEPLKRNAILVQLAEDPNCHLGRLADAFDIPSERLRQLRREYEQGGLEALQPGESGGPRRLNVRDVARLERMFADGLRPRAAQQKLKRASMSTVQRAFRAWKNARASKVAAPVLPPVSAEERTLSLPGVEMLPTSGGSVETPAAAESADDLHSASSVQHLGTWLLIAMVTRLGLYKTAERIAVGRAPFELVRVGFDATIAALAIGEHALEGVRRLRTPTAKLLLRAGIVPTPDALRELLDDLSADLGAVGMHLSMLRSYLEADRELASGEPGIFYVDNHMRPYTGQYVIRKGWRMQDERVRPGVSDYYVHDEDGRPLFRIDVPSHDSLSTWMMPIVNQLRILVGNDEDLLLAFDRGGAFPETMATLRDEGAEFVTYERAPYPELPEAASRPRLRSTPTTMRRPRRCASSSPGSI